MKCIRKPTVVDAEQFNGVDKLEGMSKVRRKRGRNGTAGND